MSVFSDLLSGLKTVDASPPAVGESRAVYADLDAARDRLDGEYPSGFAAVNEVQSVGNVDADDGVFNLTFTLSDGTTFTTGDIDHDDNAAAIITIIDTASPVSVGNGHIVVTGGPIDTAPLVITYSGASVAGKNHGEVVVTNDLEFEAGASDDPEVETVTQGQTNRTPWAALKMLGVLGGTPPVQGTSETLTAATNPNTNPYYPSEGTIRRLANEAAIADGNTAVEAAILAAAGLSLNGR